MSPAAWWLQGSAWPSSILRAAMMGSPMAIARCIAAAGVRRLSIEDGAAPAGVGRPVGAALDGDVLAGVGRPAEAAPDGAAMVAAIPGSISPEPSPFHDHL